MLLAIIGMDDYMLGILLGAIAGFTIGYGLGFLSGFTTKPDGLNDKS